VGEPNGGNFRDYDLLFTRFIPMLQEIGFTRQQVRQLLEDNPARALAVSPRLL
jgi:predicted metal-dependent phosphotriesterase family hydrolase